MGSMITANYDSETDQIIDASSRLNNGVANSSVPVTATISDQGVVFGPGLRGYLRSGQEFPSNVTPPPGFGFACPVKLTRVSGVVQAMFSRDQWIVPGSASIWVSVTRGNDTTGDGTYALPYKSFTKAFTVVAASGTTIYVEAGMYDRRYSWAVGVLPAFDVNIISVGGVAVSSTRWEGGAWTSSGSGCYYAARTAVSNVVDFSNLDSLGCGKQLLSVASQAACEATPGSYFSSSPNLYVNTFDSRAPDSNVVAFITALNGRINSANKYFVQGVEFEGGSAAAFDNGTSVAAASRLVFDRCGFVYSAGNGLAPAGIPLVISSNCYAYGNRGDGFNYHIGTNTLNVNALEIDCVSYSNGDASDGLNNDNASTAHEDCRVIRIRTAGGNCTGPIFADVGTSKSWNIDCIDFGSAVPASASNAGTQAVGFGAYDTASQWIEGGASAGSMSATYKTVGAAQYQRNASLPGSSVPKY